MFSIVSAFLMIAACAHLGAVTGLTLARTRGRRVRANAGGGGRARANFTIAVAALAGVGVVSATIGSAQVPSALASAAVIIAVSALYIAGREHLKPEGSAMWATWCILTAASVVWGTVFLFELHVDASTSWLLWGTAVVAAVTIPSSVIQTREGWEDLIRLTWVRPRLSSPPLPARLPRVSIHVPTHAEPPAVVLATLDSLAQLDYPNFEVLVIDNNTADPALWRPLEEHCARLGDRFRFLRVEGITGAKAGALNWASQFADPSAELLGVVDADYQVSPDWLANNVGHFSDPGIGFVQAPHAYRDHGTNRLQTWANWEYGVFFKTGMVALNEHNAGLTVGTMSLIRQDAIRKAGGWSEWCLTEDSELAIRLHAHGYDGVYTDRPFGWGLIPETFTAYRKQRFRWTFGPVQELRHHWRLFVPKAFGGMESALTWRQKVHHGNHGLDVACIGLRALSLPLGALAALSLVIHHERVPMPFPLWAGSTAVLVSSTVLRWLVYRRSVGATVSQVIGGTFAFASLNYVIIVASLKALLGRAAKWERTNKFPAVQRRFGALRDTRGELAVAGTGVAISIVIGIFGSSGITTMLALALAGQSLVFLASPLVALISDWELGQRTRQHKVAAHDRQRHDMPGSFF